MRLWTKLASIGIGALLLLSLVLTQSRTAWLAAITCIPLSIARQRKTLAAGFLAAAIFGAIVMFSLQTLGAHLGLTGRQLDERWDSIFERDTIRTSRVDIWRSGMIVGWRHPIIGVGAGGFLKAMAGVIEQRPDFLIRPRTIDAHNAFISVFAELGVIGLALLLVALWECAVTIARQPPSVEKMTALGLLGIVLIRMMFASAHFEKPTWFALFFTQAILTHGASGAASSDEPSGGTE